jgi:CheY-like chemotaxis protein
MTSNTPKTILIVDDEPLFLASLVDGLARYADRFRVRTAADGRMATTVCRTEHIDLVVTDLKMPEMDGFGLIAWLTRVAPTTPIIVMTAHGTREIESRLAPFETFRYLEKPIDHRALAEEIIDGLRRGLGGHLEGIALFSFLELVHMERKTCTVTVRSGERVGYLYFVDGELVNAAFDATVGQPAAEMIIGWPEPKIEIENLARKRRRTIDTPLRTLMMSALVAVDEHNRAAGADPGESVPPTSPSVPEEPQLMPNVKQILEEAMSIDGATGVALGDYMSGMVLGGAGGNAGLNLEVATAGNAEVIRAKMKVMKSLALNDRIEDILITLGDQYHLIRLTATQPNLFIYLVLQKNKANLALGRHKLSELEQRLEI